MSRNDKFRSDTLASNSIPSEIDDPMVAGALKHFKASVDSWSESAYSRPIFSESRFAAQTAQHNWRLAASWALGCLLVAGSFAGGLYEHRQRQQAARAAEVKAAEQKVRLAAEQRVTAMPVAASISIRRQPTAQPTGLRRAANTDEHLLASVDNDVSRQVPSAMEPLAQVIDDDGSN